jgi:hypothetical protein
VQTTVLQLEESRSVVIGGNGKGRVTLGPSSNFERWEIETVSVSNTSQIPEGNQQPVATVYKSGTSAFNYIESTRAGTGDLSDTKYVLMPGDFVTVEWAGATPGTFSVAILRGTRVLKGKRAY